jgi:hypothetical protein
MKDNLKDSERIMEERKTMRHLINIFLSKISTHFNKIH